MSKKIDFYFKEHDDCDWQKIYPEAHFKQTQEILSNNQAMTLDNFQIVDNKLVCSKNLHENQRLLYKFAYYTQPRSVFEVGFGYCNHLLSINKICPETEINGCDIAIAQYNNAQIFYPELKYKNFNLTIEDFVFYNKNDRIYDLVFSNAVLMHMSSYRALQCIHNMSRLGNNIIILDGGLMVPREVINQVNARDIFYFEDFAKEYWDYYTPPIIISKNGIVNQDLLYQILHEIQEENNVK